jgi:Protein of unknown function (DUF3891)
MIVTRRDGALSLVQQVEHGRIAGELAAAWGNDEFERPKPHRSVQLGAALHDEGWRAWDAKVLFDEAARRPLHFLDIEAGEHIRLYRQGVQRVALQDVYAGVLVGMHWSGLYRGRWSAPGAAGRLGRTESDRQRQDRVVHAEQRRWIDAKEEAWTAPEPRSAFETRLWHNYDLLQLWDLLSLYLVVMPQEPGAGAAAVAWGPQLRQLSHTPETVLLPPIAANPGARPLRLCASVRAFGQVTLDPFPFTSSVTIDVAHTLLPDREWARAEAARRVRTTRASRMTWRLVPPTEKPR